MTKQLIIKELSQRHTAMVDYVLSLTPKEFMFSFQNKWTAGQQMDHIIRATSLLPLAFNLPLFIPGLIFGKVNRAPLEYDELVQKYLSKLEKGAKATTIFIPKKVPYASRIKLAEKILRKISKINSAVDLISETELDHYLLPHPILGKITYREMLYFTMYHVNHHSALAKKYLAEK
ncbi:MAG: DinB family protein [Ferruginibacter sp.]|nr:DinB family protein [Ferruginibacter sp.]